MADHRTVTISDNKVRRIASEWHGGMYKPLYSLSSSGAIVPGVLAEIEECLRICTEEQFLYGKRKTNHAELKQLRRYCEIKGERGPVAGWGNLKFDNDK
jgi:hypothetical protein